MLEGERVSVYNEQVRQDRPMSGVFLKNTTDLTFENGSMTVIDGDAYAGEALMERLKPKEDRLISFALDLGTHVNVRASSDRDPKKEVKIFNGILQVRSFTSEQKVYEISNQTDRTKILWIEYPRRDNWELSEKTPKPEYTTQRYSRFRVELKPQEEKELAVALRQPVLETFQLTSLSKTDLEVFVSRGYLSPDVRAQLEKIIDVRQKIAAIDTKINAFNAESQKIEADQRRFRENIEALSKTPEAKVLIERYIAKANEQETRLEDMEKERKAAATERQALQDELVSQIREFAMK